MTGSAGDGREPASMPGKAAYVAGNKKKNPMDATLAGDISDDRKHEGRERNRQRASKNHGVTSSGQNIPTDATPARAFSTTSSAGDGRNLPVSDSVGYGGGK